MNETVTDAPRKRCAIYARTSRGITGRGEFHSLAYQRDTCSTYILSQQHRGWTELANCYEDAAISGGTLERPAFHRLIADVQQGLVDIVVVYKIDRLTRSLPDFMRLVEIFNQYDVTFVSVTQAFDATDSMGRLVLNVLLTFAEFEREIAGERSAARIRMIVQSGRAATNRLPTGYDKVNGCLVVNQAEAPIIREAFERYAELKSTFRVSDALCEKGYRTKAWTAACGKARGGGRVTPSVVHAFLGNRIYVGEIEYKGQIYPGNHEPIISRDLWDAVQAVRARNARPRDRSARSQYLFSGYIFDHRGQRMLVNENRCHRRKYRYYLSAHKISSRAEGIKLLRADGPILEEAVINTICGFLCDPAALGDVVTRHAGHLPNARALVARGPATAKRLKAYEHASLRLALENCISRIEVSPRRVRIILGCDGLFALLAQKGAQPPTASPDAGPQSPAIHMIEIDAPDSPPEERIDVMAGPCMRRIRRNWKMVNLIHRARELQAAIDANRHLSFKEATARFKGGVSYRERVLRLNYLAPDIKIAILDGLQPPALTWKRLIYGYIPMDWHLQRELFGFPSRRPTRLFGYTRRGTLQSGDLLDEALSPESLAADVE